MSRPPSARPKTSTGRVPTAGRQRPPTAASAESQRLQGSRPASRNAVSRAEPIPARTASRSGVPTRMGPQDGISTDHRPQTSSNVLRPASSSMRPITQQGLSAGRPQSRLATGSNRQVFDKTYFMGLLRGKLNMLNAEIVRLEGVWEKGEKDRQELALYEKRAEENALELKEIQGKLQDYNMIIDRMHTNSELTELELDAKEMKKKADEAASGVEDLFAERRKREEDAEKIMMQIEEQKRVNQSIMASMDSTIRERYEELREKSMQLKEEIGEREREVKELDAQRIQLENELNNSPLKQKAVELHERLLELAEKEKLLLKEKEEQETPEEKKEKLLEQVRRNNEEIAVIEKQIEQVNEQIEMSQEELREFDTDMTTIAADQNERFRELKRKEVQMDEFLATFDDQKRLLSLETEEYADAVVKNLQKISANISKVSMVDTVTGMDPSGLWGEVNAANTAKELQTVHVRLQEELIFLEELEGKLKQDIEGAEKKRKQLEEEGSKYMDIDELKRETERNSKNLEERRERLSRELPQLEGIQTDSQNRWERVNERVEADERIRKLRNVEKRLESIARDNAVVRSKVLQREAETNYEEVKKEVLRMREEYNTHLQNLVNKK